MKTSVGPAAAKAAYRRQHFWSAKALLHPKSRTWDAGRVKTLQQFGAASSGIPEQLFSTGSARQQGGAAGLQHPATYLSRVEQRFSAAFNGALIKAASAAEVLHYLYRQGAKPIAPIARDRAFFQSSRNVDSD
jgi:hypothetical protein